MTDVLNVTLRSETGTKTARRLRREGLTPAILYGHGEANVSLSVATAEVEAVIRHGSKMVDLSGDLSEKALIRAVQWDAFGSDVLHLDLNRVSVGEKVAVTVSVELKGEAPGAKLGGIVEHHVHDVEIECPAGQIPDKFVVSVLSLELGESITVGDLDVPPNVEVLTNPEDVVVSCQAAAPTEEEEAEAAEAAEAAEPEVIGRKDEEGEENAD
jgi:large subunit ribosomal protein L25